MQIVFYLESRNFKKALEILRKDEKVSLASIKSREASIIGKDGYLIVVDGLDEYCNRAKEMLKDVATTLEDNEKQLALKKIEEEEKLAAESFGSIL